MAKKQLTKRSEDYSKWYLDVIEAAELAENSEIRGCMVIKPYGYAIWENIKAELDGHIKATGHENAYFPLFIPKSYLEKEEKHASGFAKEMAVVTHSRMISDGEGGIMVDPESKLQEELVVRPTSETVMYKTYSKWINSYRDLPLLLNQWANVVRWEMRTRPFLRTSEFLWQEGHTVHATEAEAEEEALKMLEVYRQLAEDFLAMPVVTGEKSESERFAGALRTYTFEAMMQDGKALQSGTSHNLGQNFAKAFDIKFTDKDGKQKLAWQTSWGVSTRLIGGLIMTHSDDLGLVLPPSVAPSQVVVIPIWNTDKEKKSVQTEVEKLVNGLVSEGMCVEIDDREGFSPGEKFNIWEKKGVPVRVEIGPRDIAEKQIVAARRDTGDKSTIKLDKAVGDLQKMLKSIQENLYKRALNYQIEKTHVANSYDEFKEILDKDPGFILAHWDGTVETEAKINEETKATIRCIPFDLQEEDGKCIYSGKASKRRVLFAKAY